MSTLLMRKHDAHLPAFARRADGSAILLASTALVVGAVAMGASAIFVRLADVGPHASAFWRVFLALPVLWAWTRLEQSDRSLPVRACSLPIILAGVFFAGDLFFWHLSILGTTIANATFLATTSPIWVALGAWLAIRERTGLRSLFGLVLCIGGGVALLGQSYGFAPHHLRGDMYGLATGVFFGAYILAMRAARGRMGAARLSLASTTITTVCLFVVALSTEPTLLPHSWSGIAALLALALVSQVGGQGLLAVALGTLPATFSSLVIFVEALAAAAFGWLLFGEALGIVQLLGGALILIGIWTARPRDAAGMERAA